MPINPLRAGNRSRVLNALLDADAGMRTELAQHLGLSAMAVTRIVRELADAGLVLEADRRTRAEPGRRPTELAIDASGAWLLGFELHAYQCSVALMDLTRRVVHHTEVTLTSPTDGARCLGEMVAAGRAAIHVAGVAPERVPGAGVATMGVVDRARGILVDPSYLGWPALDLATPLGTGLGRPVVVDRIANALLAAEAHMTTGGLRNALLVNVGFVLSAAFLVDGVLARGESLTAGQIGHVALEGARRRCPCGQRGCLNVVASGWAALADKGTAEPELSPASLRASRPRLTNMLHRESDGDRAAMAALHRAGRNLGHAVRNLRTALDPARIFLSGPVGRATSFMDGMRLGIGHDAAPLIARCDRGVAEAAALMAFDEFVRSPRLDFERLRGISHRHSARARTSPAIDGPSSA